MKHICGIAAIIMFSLASLVSCTEETAPSGDYGHVQFKLYKEAFYEQTKSLGSNQIQYLADVSKISLRLMSDMGSFSQTLVLGAADETAAEYGLRSAKLQLLGGDYTIISYSLYDKSDELIDTYTPNEEMRRFTIVPGGLCVHDLVADVVARGKVKFTLVKDLSAFVDIPQTRAPQREYTFSEIKTATIRVRSDKNVPVLFEKLPVKFSTHFSENDDPEDGYITSSAVCDTLLALKAGSYEVEYYEFYDTDKVLLEKREVASGAGTFVVEDNRTTDADVKVLLFEEDEYIRDYYALYAIWKALDGPKWFYSGQEFTKGVNWDFNKDPDLWGDQPGVNLHPDGRIASINVSDFGFSGYIPSAIRQLTALEFLYLGTHNDANVLDYDPTIKGNDLERLENHKKYLRMIHPEEQLSYPLAFGLAHHGKVIPATEMYQTLSENEVLDNWGKMRVKPMDILSGKLCNGLISIDPAIGECTNLKKLYIANGKVASLPSTLENLKNLTDIEIYNCPEMVKFPEVLCKLESLESVNLSNNKQWTSDVANAGFDKMANGRSKRTIQIFYMNENNLTEIKGESVSQMHSLGLLDLSYNKIRSIGPFGKHINMIQLYLDNNELENIPHENGVFCGMNDVENFSVTYNRLKQFPDIFSAKSNFKMASVNFSYNQIEGFEGEQDGSFKGLVVGTLSLTNNKLKEYPKCLADSDSYVEFLNLRGCGIEKIPAGSFKYDRAVNLTSLDLSYNHLSDVPSEMNSLNMPYLYGVDLSYNRFSEFPWEILDSGYLTVFAFRGQRDAQGGRCFTEWPVGIYKCPSLRGLFLGDNNIGVVDDYISPQIYQLDISANPEIVFDASTICAAYKAGVYILIYDKGQNIIGCDVL